MRLSLIFLAIASLALESCGLARSALQMPGRTLKGLGRTTGFNLTSSEIVPVTEESGQANKKAGKIEKN